MSKWLVGLVVLSALLCPAWGAARALAGDFMGLVDSFGYGYKVRVSINQVPVKVITGGGQQATRLFSTDHKLKSQAPPAQQDLFILREGQNTISLEFEKLPGATNSLQVKVEAPRRYSVPLFHLTSRTRQSGKVERKFVIAPAMPAGFATVTVTDADL